MQPPAEFNFITDYTACVSLLAQAETCAPDSDDYFHFLQMYAETYHALRCACPRSLRSSERWQLESAIVLEANLQPLTYLRGFYLCIQHELGLTHTALSALACE